MSRRSAAEAEGKTLTEAQNEGARGLAGDSRTTFIPNREDAKENTRKMKSDYATVASYVRPLAFKMQTMFLPIIIWDSLALMLLGLALYRWGFLSGQWSNRHYWKVIADRLRDRLAAGHLQPLPQLPAQPEPSRPPCSGWRTCPSSGSA